MTDNQQTAPLRGHLFASCGCKVEDIDALVPVRWRETTCDAVDGFSNAVGMADYCPACAERLRASEYWIGTDAEEAAWLSRGRK